MALLEDHFGFLPYDRPIAFEGITITPLPNYSEIVSAVTEVSHEDGFWYPPPFHREVDRHDGEPPQEVPRTRRPAHLWKVPATHTLAAPTSLERDAFRRDAGVFIVHLLGYFFGTRLQFHDWWVDSRIPTTPKADFIDPSRVVEPFMSTCLRTWQAWSPDDQKAMTGLLYMHTRVPSYEWAWERFAFEYMVFDGLYALAAPRYDLSPRGLHSERIKLLCDKLAIPTEPTYVERIVDLRNDLFHEVTFGNATPGFGGHGEVYVLPFRLRDLNRRIIAAVLGWDVPFVHSEWWHLDSVAFDRSSPASVGSANHGV